MTEQQRTAEIQVLARRLAELTGERGGRDRINDHIRRPLPRDPVVDQIFERHTPKKGSDDDESRAA